MNGTATAMKTDPVRLAAVFREYRLVVWCDAMEKWGMSRGQAIALEPKRGGV